FNHGYPAADEAGLHAFHAAELPYVFANHDRTPPQWPKAPDSDGERALTAAMSGYWASFARSGQPVAAGQPAWQPYRPGRAHRAFDGAPRSEERRVGNE